MLRLKNGLAPCVPEINTAAVITSAKTADLEFCYQNNFPVFTDGKVYFSVCKMRDVLSWYKSSDIPEEDVLNMLDFLKANYSQVTYLKTHITRGFVTIDEIDYILDD